VCFNTGCSQSITNSLDNFEEPPTKGDFVTVKTMTGTTKIKAFGIVRWVVYDIDGTARLLRVPAYYIPDSDIRLMSPQSYGQFHGWNSRVDDNLGGNNFQMWLLLNIEDSTTVSKLEIPISTFDNLPHFRASLHHAKDPHRKLQPVRTSIAQPVKCMHLTWKYYQMRTRT
jgi:hypothetical protein